MNHVLMTMLTSVTDTINTSFIIRDDTRSVVIDGGFASEADALYDAIASVGGHVDAWFITHPHSDHFGALTALLEAKKAPAIDRLIFTFPTDGAIRSDASDGEFALYERFCAAVAASGIPVTAPARGDVYDFGTFSFRVLRVFDPAITHNLINNASTVLRLTAGETSVIFLGDLGIEGGFDLLSQATPEELSADFVQMAHHGQSGVTRAVYEAIAPSACLWCTPTWLWDNLGANGYDSGHFETVITRGWMSELGVRRHYLAWQGTQEIPLGE